MSYRLFQESPQQAISLPSSEGSRIDISIVPFLASVARYLVTLGSVCCGASVVQEDQTIQTLPSALRSRIESVVQTALNAGISAHLLIAACLVAAVGLHQPRDNSESSTNSSIECSVVSPPSCLSSLEDSVLELALHQCFIEACLASTTTGESSNTIVDECPSGGSGDHDQS